MDYLRKKHDILLHQQKRGLVMQRSTRTRRDKHSQVRSETTCPSTLKQGSPEHDLRNSAEASNRFTSTPFHSESLCNRAGSGPDWVMVASMALWPRFRAYSRCELLLVRTDTHVSWVSNSGLRIRHLRVVASNVVGHAVVSEGSMTILVSHLSSRHYSRNVKMATVRYNIVLRRPRDAFYC